MADLRSLDIGYVSSFVWFSSARRPKTGGLSRQLGETEKQRAGAGKLKLRVAAGQNHDGGGHEIAATSVSSSRYGLDEST